MQLFRFGRPPLRARRLARVLRAGLRDPYYGPLLQGAGPEAGIAGLPFSGLESWVQGRELPDRPAVVRHPLNEGVLAARPASCGGLYTALAAPAAELLEAARRPERDRPRVEFAVLILERPGNPGLTESARNLLWDAFEVPVYRLFIGFDGTLLAHDCELQQTLHATGDAIFESQGGRLYFTSLTDRRNPCLRLDTGFNGSLDETLCDCGRPGVRLVCTRPAIREDTPDVITAAD